MKRTTLIILTIILAAGMLVLSGCEDKSSSEKADPEKLAEDEYASAFEVLENSDSFADASDYLEKWAKDKKIKIEESTDEYLVLAIKATEGYEGAETATLQIPIGSGDPALRCEVLSVLLAAVESSEAHGDVKVIFTNNTGNDFSGAKELNAKYLNTDNFINFMYENMPTVYNQGGASSYNRVSLKSSLFPSEHEKAFRVSITGVSGGIAGSAMSADTPNPIETIAGFLAAAKSDGYVFDLADFDGGSSAGTIPKRASAVIVIPATSVNSLEKRFETSHKRFEKKYGEIEPDAEYTLTEVEKPAGVLSDSAKDDIINLIYMFETGSKQDKNGNTVSSSNIGAVSVKDGRFTAKIALEDIRKEELSDMQLSLETSCGLCHMKCSTVSKNEPWITYENSYLVTKLSDLCSAEPKSTIVQNENTVFKKRNKKLPLVSFGVNKSSSKRSIKVITKFLASLNDVEEN